MGKKIAYKDSELRVENLTGKICDGLRYYSYMSPRKTKSEKPDTSKSVKESEGWARQDEEVAWLLWRKIEVEGYGILGLRNAAMVGTRRSRKVEQLASK